MFIHSKVKVKILRKICSNISNCQSENSESPAVNILWPSTTATMEKRKRKKNKFVMDGRWPCRLLPGIVLLSLVLLHFLLPLFSQLLKTFLTLKTRVLYSHRWTPSPPERRMLILSAIISHNTDKLGVEESLSYRFLCCSWTEGLEGSGFMNNHLQKNLHSVI